MNGKEDRQYSDEEYDGDGEVVNDVFGKEEQHAIKYKTLSWQMVAFLMIAEIVSNGVLSLPSAVAATGLVASVICIAFLGIFALYTSWLLIQFKLRHPDVHTMGDAGYILFGPLGREIFAAGTILFAVFATGSQYVAGQTALAVLSDNKLCSMLYTGIFAAATLIVSFPRTFDNLSWLGVAAAFSIFIAGIVGMVGAGLYPVPDRVIYATVPTTFVNAFSAITNPVFAYAGHFMFFALISEMRHPEHAFRSAIALQTFSTAFYILFAVVTYVYIGPTVGSPSLISLKNVWAKAAFGIALVNFLVAGALYAHLASKLIFVRLFRKHGRRHMHEHTIVGWGTWTALIVLMNGATFVLAIGVPIFNYIVGLAASLFASWYTYGVAGMFWIYDAWHDKGLRLRHGREWSGTDRLQFALSVLTILLGLFICVAGLYVVITGIVDAYNSGAISQPFAC